jgi:hypothetical protein
MQRFDNNSLTDYPRSNQVNPSQSESNQLHRLDQHSKVQLNRTASQPVAVIKSLEGHADAGFSLRLCTLASDTVSRVIHPAARRARGSPPQPTVNNFALLPVWEKTNQRKAAKAQSQIRSKRVKSMPLVKTPCKYMLILFNQCHTTQTTYKSFRPSSSQFDPVRPKNRMEMYPIRVNPVPSVVKNFLEKPPAQPLRSLSMKELE